MVEGRGDDAARAHLAAARVPDTRAGDGALDEGQSLVDGGAVCGVDGGAGGVIAEGPEDRG